ncbi:MAG: glycoside hydrolase family 32 protein [Bacteroidia bacterium]|nr:glycoside hydrolase family 32 protein [Bacteroidia bacterium]
MKREIYRPIFHFTPMRNWMNDPNGLIYLNGFYHLFYQYNPDGDQWGNISWGHARSKNLMDWEELPVAIPCTQGEMIFSGCTLIDEQNRAGFGQNALIAIYTSFEYEIKDGGEMIALAQHQSLAFSHDEGLSFTKYEGNPILDIGSVDFRDPKVIWHEPTSSWVMLVSLADQHKIAFYRSKSLIKWQKSGEFGPAGNTDAVWECPDLFWIKEEGKESGKWILTISAGSPHPNYLGMQSFIGEFDGHTFIPDKDLAPAYLDYGKDYYAGITFSNTGNQHYAIMMAWLSNHIYARFQPTSPWRGAMSFPRRMTLANQDGKLYLKQSPHLSLEEKGKKIEITFPTQLKNDSYTLPFHSQSFELILEIESLGAKEFGLRCFEGSGRHCQLAYRIEEEEFYIDRTNSGQTDFFDGFASTESCQIQLRKACLHLHLLVDRSIIEVFLNDGERLMTQRVFPLPQGIGISIFALGGDICIRNLQVLDMQSFR